MADEQIIIRVSVDNEQSIKDVNKFTKTILSGKETIDELVEAQKELLTVARQTTDRSTEGYKTLIRTIGQVSDKINDFKKDLKDVERGQSFERLNEQIEKTDNTVNGLILRRKLLTDAFNDAQLGSKEQESLRRRLAEVNAELKRQRDSLKASTNALGGVNEATKFARGSYGELRQQIKAAKDELQRYTVGSKQFEDAQQRLNTLLQREIDIRRTQPSLFQTRIRQAINESEAVKTLRTNLSRLRIERQKLVDAGKEGTAEFKKLESQIARTEKQIARASKSTGGLTKTFKQLGALLAAKVGFDIIQRAVVDTITVYKDFEQAVKDVQAVSGANAEQLKELTQNALDLGGATQFTATQVAELQKELAKLGFTPDEIVQATEAIVDLATATGESLAESATVAGSTLRSFGLETTETKRLADLLAGAFSSTALDLEKFRESIKLVAPVANAANISLEAATATLGALANRGIDGSIAGTGLRRIFTELSTEGSKVSKAIDLVVKSDEDLIEALRRLNTLGIDNAKAFELFGRNAQSAAIGIVNAASEITGTTEGIDGATESTRGLIEQFRGFEDSAKRIADIQRDTLNAQFNIFISALERLQIELVNLTGGALKDFVIGLTDIVNTFTDFIALPISEQLQQEQQDLNGLVTAITLTNDNQELRNDLIEELQTIYPDFLANLDAERVTNEELLERLEEVNEAYVARIALQRQEERVQEQAEATTDAFERQRDTVRELGDFLALARKQLEEVGVTVQNTGDPFNDATDAIEKLRIEAAKLPLQGRAFNSFANTATLLRNTITDLTIAQNDYTKSNEELSTVIADRVALQKELSTTLEQELTQTQLLESTIESLEQELSTLNQAGDEDRRQQIITQIQALQLQLQELKEFEKSAQESVNTSNEAGTQTAKNLRDQIRALQKQIASLVGDREFDLAQGLVSQLEKLGEEGKEAAERAADRILKSRISNFRKELTEALKADDFDLAETLTNEIREFGEEGEKAYRAALEKILKARLDFIDRQRQFNEVELDIQQSRLELEEANLIESERRKLAALRQAGQVRIVQASNVSEQLINDEELLSDELVQIEQQRLDNLINANTAKLKVLEDAGKAETTQAKELQAEILAAEQDFLQFLLDRRQDIDNERLEQAIRFRTANLQLIQEGLQRELEQLRINQAERLNQFREDEQQLEEDFARRQQAEADRLRARGADEQEIERRLADNRQQFQEQQNDRLLATQAQFEQERLNLIKQTQLQANQLQQDFITTAQDGIRARLEQAVAEQRLALTKQLEAGEISLKEFSRAIEDLESRAGVGDVEFDRTEELEEQQRLLDQGLISQQQYDDAVTAILNDQLRTFFDIEKAKTDILVAEIENRIALLENGTEEERLEAERLRNNITKIRAEQASAEAGFIQTTNDNSRKSKEQQIADVEETLQTIQEAVTLIDDFFNQIAEARLQALDRRVAQREENIQKLEEQLEDANEQQAAAIKARIDVEKSAIAEIDAEREKIERQAFLRNKAQAISQAIINGALAITKLIAQETLAAPFLIPLIAGLTAAQIGVIAAQQFALGGVLGDFADSINNPVIKYAFRNNAEFASGGVHKDGIRVVEGGNIPDNGIAQGRRHSTNPKYNGIKFISKDGKMSIMEGGEYTSVMGNGGNATRFIYTRNVAKNPTLLAAAKLTGGSYDPMKAALGSFVNQMGGGASFFADGGMTEIPKFNPHTSTHRRLSTKEASTFIAYHQTYYQSGGLLAAAANASSNDLTKVLIGQIVEQNEILKRQQAVMEEQVSETRRLQDRVKELEIRPDVPFVEAINGVQSDLDRARNRSNGAF